MNYTAFFEGREPDDKNRMITDFLKYSAIRLELSHDYIQRIFPLQEQSRFSDAPLITDAEIREIKVSKTAQENIRSMYNMMLWFWKIDDAHIRKWKFPAPVRLWNTLNNHNHLRMTRVLKSLRLLGMDNEYQDFSKRLCCIISLQGKDVHISRETAQIWEENMDKAIHQSLQDIIEMYGENKINKVLDSFEPLPEDKEYMERNGVKETNVEKEK